MHTSTGCTASAYPPGMALLAAPFYLPTILTNAPSTELLSQFDKLAASLLSAAAVLCWVRIVQGRLRARLIFGATAYDSPRARSPCSQTLWQQTGVSLGVAALLMSRSLQAPNLWHAFFGAAIVALVRAPDLPVLLPLLLVTRGRRVYLFAGSGALTGVLGFLAYNKLIFGGWLVTGYKLM